MSKNIYQRIEEAKARGELPADAQVWGELDASGWVPDWLHVVAMVQDENGVDQAVIADDPAWEAKYQAALAKVRAEEAGK